MTDAVIQLVSFGQRHRWRDGVSIVSVMAFEIILCFYTKVRISVDMFSVLVQISYDDDVHILICIFLQEGYLI